jgi:hypothetical protein
VWYGRHKRRALGMSDDVMKKGVSQQKWQKT